MSYQLQPIYGEHFGPGYIGFTNSTSAISEGITWFSSAEEAIAFEEDLPKEFEEGASHTFVAVSKMFGIESSVGGVKTFPLSKYIDDPHVQLVFRKPLVLDEIVIAELIARMVWLEQQKTPYDYTGLVGYVLKILSPLDNLLPFINKLPAPLHWPGGLFCSAAVSDGFKHTQEYADLPLFRKFHVSRISPNMFWNRFPWKPLRLTEDSE